jgi:Histidine kinase-like ATPase domain
VTGAYPVLHVGSFGSADPVRSARPWARTFRGTPASVPEARRFVAELLAGCPACEVLMTCVSELCANAITHTDSGNGGVFIVEVDLTRPGVARIAVTDEGGPSLPVAGHLDLEGDPSRPAVGRLDLEGGPSLPAAGRVDLMAEGGRGLAMVAACTSRWGYADAYPGRTVWAEACWPVAVPSPGRATPQPAAPQSAAPQSAARRTTAPRPRLRIPRSSPVPPDDWPPRDVPPGPAA